jgi:hypothetical protein
MPSASGLSRDQRIRCRDRVVQAARLTLANKAHTHYTEGPLRWDGIKNQRDAEIGQFPEYSDCSSFATWCLWNGLVLRFGLGDVVNGAGWTAGYTGTMLEHGLAVQYAWPITTAQTSSRSGDTSSYTRGPLGNGSFRSSPNGVYTGGSLDVLSL